MNALQRLANSGFELWSAILALGLAVLSGMALTAVGSFHVRRSSLLSLLVSILLGPTIAVVGAWLHVRRGQAVGLVFLVLAALLSLDGAISTYFTGLPVFALVLLSLVAGIARGRPVAGGSPLGD